MASKSFAECKAIVFDLMGTCCDWQTGIVRSMQNLPVNEQLQPKDYPNLALEWRAGFFQEIHHRFEQGLPQEDIDVTHRRVLDRILRKRMVDSVWDDAVRQQLVTAWHDQVAWPDAIPALERLRRKYFVVVLANGTTRLQLDIAKSSGLPFHMLFSSQLLGLTKPDLAIYRKAADLMGLRPEECIMVAAHAYDLRAATQVGMKTVYIRRNTEDVGEDFDEIEQSVDVYFDGRDGSRECGLARLAEILNVRNNGYDMA